MTIPPEEIKYFEELGAANVSQIASTGPGFSSPRQIYALKWLAGLDEATVKHTETLQARETQRSQSTLEATWIGIGIAIGAVAVGILTWIFPSH
jgi:hypothetical protein